MVVAVAHLPLRLPVVAAVAHLPLPLVHPRVIRVDRVLRVLRVDPVGPLHRGVSLLRMLQV